MKKIIENQLANNGSEGLAQLANERQNDAREARTPLRLVKMKFDTNAKMVRTLTAAVSKGIDKLILTPRVDVAGCGYVWLGIRKGRIELDGKLLLNRQIGEYLLAYLQGDRVARDHGLRLRSGNLLPARLAGGDRDKTGETRHNRRRGVHRDGRDGLPDAKVPLPERQGDYAFRRDCRRNRVAGLMMLNGTGAGLTARPSVL